MGKPMMMAAATLALAGAAQAQRSMGTMPVGDPAGWFGPESYPPEAIRANRQGRVLVRLDIDAAGAVAACTVTESSGTAALDEGTCALARERGRFNPAIDQDGKPIASQYTLPVRWVLPAAATRPPADIASMPPHLAMAAELRVGVDGRVFACKVLERAPEGRAGDPCPARVIGELRGVLTRGGEPIAYRVVQRLSVEIAADQPVMDGTAAPR